MTVTAPLILSSFFTCRFRAGPTEEMAPPVGGVKSIKGAAGASHALSLVAEQLNPLGWYVHVVFNLWLLQTVFYSYTHGHIISFVIMFS